MIKVSVLYANDGNSFDMEYYLNSHMLMVASKLGGALKSSAVEQGLSGAEPGSAAPYIAMGHLYFDKLEDFQNSFGPHAAEIMADIPNYTAIQPSIQISEVKL